MNDNEPEIESQIEPQIHFVINTDDSGIQWNAWYSADLVRRAESGPITDAENAVVQLVRQLASNLDMIQAMKFGPPPAAVVDRVCETCGGDLLFDVEQDELEVDSSPCICSTEDPLTSPEDAV